MMPHNPEDGGVGSRGQAVMDCSQLQIDHREPASEAGDDTLLLIIIIPGCRR